MEELELIKVEHFKSLSKTDRDVAMYVELLKILNGI